MHSFLVYIFLGSVGGFLSGLLGIGGALVMIPLMLEVPPLFGLDRLSMQMVSGLSMIQVVFASVSGVLRHSKSHCVHRRLLWVLGTGMVVSSLVGAVLSSFMPELGLMMVFGVMAVSAAAMMFFRPPRLASGIGTCDFVPFNKGLAAVIGCGVGLVAGMVGAGGGFLLIPLMIYALRIPIRVTIGTSLGVVLAGSLAGGLGKLFTGQFMLVPALGLVAGSVVMAQAGAAVSRKVPSRVLHGLLLASVLLACIQIWREIIVRLVAG